MKLLVNILNTGDLHEFIINCSENVVKFLNWQSFSPVLQTRSHIEKDAHGPILLVKRISTVKNEYRFCCLIFLQDSC